jgi:plastocyanin
MRRFAATGAAGLGALLLAVAPAAAATPRTRTAPALVAQPAGPTTTKTTTTTTAAPLIDPFAPVTTTATTAPAPSPTPAATAPVSIVDFGFSPSSITVSAGTTVVWTNTGQSIHSVTSDTGAFDSNPSCPTGSCLDPGATYSHTFSTAGTFAYHCRVHSNMVGTVLLKAAATGTTTTVAGPATTAAPGVSAGGAPSASPSTTGTGAQLAFTGSAPAALWLTFGALLALAAGLALRPRRRPFPVPVRTDPKHRAD